MFETADEMQLMQRIHGFQTTLIRVLSEGFKQLKIPIWWTSFEEGTLKDFNAEYKKKVYRHIDNIYNFYYTN